MINNSFYRIGKKIIPLVLMTVWIFCYTMQVAAASVSQVISRGNANSNEIALTFDDGYDGENADAILEILSQNNIKATFFITGEAAIANPAMIKKIIENGNELGNHSYSHPAFTRLSYSQMQDEVNRAETSIYNLTEKSTLPYFRPPYGDYNSAVLQAVVDINYNKTITWTIDTLDWSGISAEEITRRVLDNASSGAIVLMHVNSGAKNTKYALQDIIDGLKSKGYTIVSLSQLLANNTTPDGTQYIVKPGDTLTAISKAHRITVQQILDANDIPNPDLIYVGQVLTIP